MWRVNNSGFHKQQSNSESDIISPYSSKHKYDKKKFCFKIRQKIKRGQDNLLIKGEVIKKEIKNSDLLFFNEFIHIFKRKEYCSQAVEKYFKRLTSIDTKKYCHVCGKQMNMLKTRLINRCFCYFCMEYVCDKQCLSDETFIIPRSFNIDFDLRKKPVCQSAAMLLNRNNYIKIENNHPQVGVQQSLYQFMVHRRRIHKMFDLIKCEEQMNIMNNYASEKYMVMKDFYITI